MGHINDAANVSGNHADHPGGNSRLGAVDLARADAGDGRAAVSGESAALLMMIERAARDTSIDIDRMERLFKLHEAAEARRARTAYIAALAVMQPELPVIDKRGEIERTKKDDHGAQQKARATKYAKWEDVVEAITPVLAKHGFSISFRIRQGERVEVVAILGHRAGHCEETSLSLPIDTSGAKNNLQGWGSSISYGKRYTAFALLNVVARGEDDDGTAAGMDETISDEQAELIKEAIEKAGRSLPRFCAYYRIQKVSDLPAAKLAGAMKLIRGRHNG